jgi:pSer/pThr/pTyr-binding forkhead associated (FHA) protein
MPAQLVSLDEGMRILLDKPILLLGRDSECDIQFESRKISRRHCCIAHVGERLIVRDLGSTNGVRINGVRVVEGYLKAGDELSIGSHRYQVAADGSVPLPRRTSPKRERQAPVQESDDDFLESSDVPIPISDRQRKKSRPSSKSKDKKRSTEDESKASGTDSGSRLIPDQLGLAPSSDIGVPGPPVEPTP